MESQPEPLLKFAEELLHSYSRLIVYSGDILRSLPEPREGLSIANIKPKKDESTAFQREWQHLESVFDEYLIRLNDIRTRAHEELEAARVKCLTGESIDLTLPEAAVKLGTRLARYKRQYESLLQVVDGGSIEDFETVAEESSRTDHPTQDGPDINADAAGETNINPEIAAASIVETRDIAPVLDTPAATLGLEGHDIDTQMVDEEDGIEDDKADDYYDDYDDYDVTASQEDLAEDELVDGDADLIENPSDANTPMSIQNTEHPFATTDSPNAGPIDVDAEPSANPMVDGETIELDSESDLDDEDMEDIFQ
ncbi:hypothetical protein GGI04_001407 [Coemansia thaxteri]|uniref:Uncharacterized protein n=1 Tax=Coemansia thaxteri TaxID=2663907 RepID=A0A9W8EIU6_9FUNG|nr:hypothetical protein H4R26_003777 [Coemansia thaxteri]KAJ2007757.1 hypothetical protein GGI04_001407 [Coemansia thaxteri]KAJ2472818.1 hypothetical protein GGI02_001326 [Coemansia sp. RSA 2322]KAJ2481650.1 hypothetical protein EV174_003412 [Coemansia sp. RSA 2320]